MSEPIPNAILLGGPEPHSGRHVYAGPDTEQYSPPTADGPGHTWVTTYRIEPCKGGLRLRVYTYAGPPTG